MILIFDRANLNHPASVSPTTCIIYDGCETPDDGRLIIRVSIVEESKRGSRLQPISAGQVELAVERQFTDYDIQLIADVARAGEGHVHRSSRGQRDRALDRHVPRGTARGGIVEERQGGGVAVTEDKSLSG